LNVDKAEIILDAADKIFKRYGYTKTTMDDIAHEAMIGKGTIYYYFKTKEDIFLTIMKKSIDEIAVVLKEKIDKSKTFSEKMKVLFIDPHDLFLEHHELIMQVINNDSPAFLRKIQEFKCQNQIELKKALTAIFLFGVKTHSIREKYVDSIDTIVDMFLIWVQYVGDQIHRDISAGNIKETIGNYMLFLDIFVSGLTNKQEVQ